VLGTKNCWKVFAVNILPRAAIAALGVVMLVAAASWIPTAQPELPPLNRPGWSKQSWGATPDGRPVEMFTLQNSRGIAARITNYGATLVSLTTPDRSGRMADIVLGFDSIEGYTSRAYLRASPYFGATIGRYANRIAGGRFSLNGKVVSLRVNNPPNHLHGGFSGFDKAVWEASVGTNDEPSLQLNYKSKDGEEGYPGNMNVTVIYTLKDDALDIVYQATTDQDTIINLTNHSYFNLKGAGEGDILNHELQINADRFTPVNEALVPTGELRPTDDTPFDFKKPMQIGTRISAKEEQLSFGRGYDHNFVLTGPDALLKWAARVREPSKGRTLEIWTTEPGLQVYTGNFLRGDLVGKKGKTYGIRGGLCLETQHFPDSPNQREFPSTVVSAGGKYTSHTIFRLGVDQLNPADDAASPISHP
jgi:aldose 1-epimerase